MPKLPFSLFDFKHIDKFGHLGLKHLEAAAGAAIPETVIYQCPDYKFALILSASIIVTKTTGTALTMIIVRATREKVDTEVDLINETADSGPYCWPSGKAAGEHALGWCLCFMFPGDELRVSQALTLAETIDHQIEVIGIEYSDPRYEK